MDGTVVLDPGVAGFRVTEDRALDSNGNSSFISDGAADRLANDDRGD